MISVNATCPQAYLHVHGLIKFSQPALSPNSRYEAGRQEGHEV